MMKRLVLITAILVSAVQLNQARAMNIDWNGLYRFEWVQVDRPSLSNPHKAKAYGLNYLSLTPKILASDGVEIVSRIDLLSSQDSAYQYGQFGEIWGGGLPASSATNADTSRNNAFSQTQGYTFAKVKLLYMTVNQEYGSLLVGRAPYGFGMGITHNSGHGLFDHWMDVKDVLAYKFYVGNVSFMPMFAKMSQTNSALGGSALDQILEINYDSKETGSQIGLVLEKRKGSVGANDAPVASLGGSSIGSDYGWQRSNFILGRNWESIGLKFEAALVDGDTGVLTSGNEYIRMNGYAVAAEIFTQKSANKWGWNVKMGMASGDNPTTKDYEAYHFDRNYDVAMLMFNHRLGGKDFLTTNLIKDTTAGRDQATSLDDEAISNAIYISPQITYAHSDKIDFNTRITYAQLVNNPTNSLDFQKDLGLEFDIGINYHPTERIQWINQLGFLFPGSAFQDGSSKLDNSSTMGFESKAAISF